jgi:hypothetical protein
MKCFITKSKRYQCNKIIICIIDTEITLKNTHCILKDKF